MMSLEVILLLCAFTVHSTTSQPDLEIIDTNLGISGGYRVSDNDAPFMAALSFPKDDTNFKKCGGSIIHEQFILTAASCCKWSKNYVSRISISVGSNQRSKGEIYAAEELLIHHWYDNDSFEYNACVIKLNDTLTFGPAINKIILADDSVVLNYDTKLNTFGWGNTENGEESEDLLAVSVPLVSETKCSKIKKGLMICAGARGKDSCGGDGGGPLTLLKSIQFGITSHGSANCGSVGVYTKVAAVLPWIESMVHKYSR